MTAKQIRAAIIATSVLTLIFLYCSMASGELRGMECGGHYSLFSSNPDCRTPVLFAIGFYVSLGVTVALAVKAFRSREC